MARFVLFNVASLSGEMLFRRAKRRHLALGRRGEKIARTALRELGMEVLVKNYTAGRDEIDLVARHWTTLCFVEVKTRRREILATPASAVGRDKRRHIVRAARNYLRRLGNPPVKVRYDIVEVILDGRRLKCTRYWPNAFLPD